MKLFIKFCTLCVVRQVQETLQLREEEEDVVDEVIIVLEMVNSFDDLCQIQFLA